MSADTIVELLAQRHGDDVFVPGCKTGPTPCPILDAWAMKKSWANARTFGYEVKVDRSDFLRDDKWTSYLDVCTDFYFVCPPGLISVDEVGANAGLLYVTKTGTRLFTKKKAPHRDVPLDPGLCQYVLQSRTTIRPAGFFSKAPKTKAERAEAWRQWLAERAEHKRLGYVVSKAIREHVDEVELENGRLKSENEELADIRCVLTELGVKPGWRTERAVRRQVERLQAAVPADTMPAVEKAIGALEVVRNALNGGEA